MENKDVQKIAKMTIQYAKEIIKPGMSLIDLRNDLEKKMLELGADSFWYWDVGAFIFSGDETNVSISGKHYVTANKTIQNNDIITIDLSPQNNNVWGDYARTIIIENGIVVDCVENIENEEIPQITKSIVDLANEVIAGKYGVGEARKQALGSLYNEVQAKVNEILLGKTTSNRKSNEEIADEVIEGKWGNGTDRKQKLATAGYDYNAIQSIVNRKLR